MCIAMNGDRLAPGQYAVSTSNRNFEGTPGERRTDVSCVAPHRRRRAVTGTITDVRSMTLQG